MGRKTMPDPGPELDALVAEAIGKEHYFDHGIPIAQDGVDAVFRRYSPSTDWTAAMSAAEEVGLFDPNRGGYSIRQCLNTHWILQRGEDGWFEFEERTGPHAISLAILKLKGK